MPKVSSTRSYAGRRSLAGADSCRDGAHGRGDTRSRGRGRVARIADCGSCQTPSPPHSLPQDPAGSRPTPEQPIELPDTSERLLAIIRVEVARLVLPAHPQPTSNSSQHYIEPYPVPQVTFCVCACMCGRECACVHGVVHVRVGMHGTLVCVGVRILLKGTEQ